MKVENIPLFLVTDITRKGVFSNTASFEAMSDGQRVEVRFNSVFVNNDWIKRWSEDIRSGDTFSGLIGKNVRIGDAVKLEDIENLRPE